MRKILWIIIVLFLIGGTVTFAQEVDQSLWFYKLEIVAGFQMGFVPTEDGDLSTRPAVVIGFRQYLRPVFRSLILGYSIFGIVSFASDLEWRSPDDQYIKMTGKDNDYDFFGGFGGLVGASLQGRMFGPVGLALDIGIIGNYWTITGGQNNSWSSQYQGHNVNYFIIDLGLGLNAGMLIDFGRFSLEGGANLGYSFFRFDLFDARRPGGSGAGVESGSSSGVADIIKMAPYIMVGFRF